MRTAKRLVLAIMFACISVSLAHAGTQVLRNQSTTIKAAVKNVGSRSVSAAVKLTGYDDAGVVIGSLCQNAYLRQGQTTKVDFYWQAPSYATGVYWASKIEVGSYCPHDYHDEHDDDEHDD